MKGIFFVYHIGCMLNVIFPFKIDESLDFIIFFSWKDILEDYAMPW